MPPPSICRLCTNKCINVKKLYEDDGVASYENKLMQKYINSTILNMDKAKHLTVICSQCWNHISDYHNFLECVILAQKKLETEWEKLKNANDLLDPMEDQRIHDNIVIKIDNDLIPCVVQTMNENQSFVDSDESIVMSNIDEIPIQHLSPSLLPLENAVDIRNEIITFEYDSDDSSSDFLGFETNKESEEINEEKREGEMETSQGDKTNQQQYLNSKEELPNIHLNELVSKFIPNIKCNECPETFASFSLMQLHFQRKHKEKGFYLRCCKIKLKSPEDIEEHFTNHTIQGKFKCENCDKTFVLKHLLNEHLKKTHPESSKTRSCSCPKCSKTFALKNLLKHHLKTCDGNQVAKSSNKAGTSAQFVPDENGNFVCNICKKGYENVIALQKHMKHNHQDKGKHKCSFCGESFSKRFKCLEHISIQHTGEHLYACPNCPKTFLRRGLLLSHQKQLHGINSGKSCCTPPHRCSMHSEGKIPKKK